MQAILVSLLVAGIHSGMAGLGGALAALRGADWLTLAEGAGEIIAPELGKIIGLKPSGNSIGSLIDGVIKAATDELTKQAVKDWLSANSETAMRLQPGMGTNY